MIAKADHSGSFIELRGRLEEWERKWPGLGAEGGFQLGIESLALATRACAAVPVSDKGRPLFKFYGAMLEQGRYSQVGVRGMTSILRAAARSYALSVGSEDLYRLCCGCEPTTDKIPRVDKFKFIHPLWRLTRALCYPSLDVDTAEVLSRIRQLGDIAENLLKSDHLYSPFFKETQPHRQVEIGGDLTQLRETLYRDVDALECGKRAGTLMLLMPRTGIVIGSMCRAHLLPMMVPVSDKPGDFDSGYCDKLSHTSFRLGDRVIIVASYGQFQLIATDGSCGWVEETDVAILEEDSAWHIDDAFLEVFYGGGQPNFLDSTTILPGDSLWWDGKSYYQARRSIRGAPILRKVETVEGMRIDTPQGLLEFLYGIRLPYLYSLFDCSEVSRRALNLAGFSVRKHSGDALDDLTEVLGEPQQVRARADLDNLEDGLYHVNLLEEKSVGQISRHIYWVTVWDGNIDVFSYAFRVLGNDGSFEYPVGSHTCGREALIHQLSYGRFLSFHKIAGPDRRP
jgi:hypothetical protein